MLLGATGGPERHSLMLDHAMRPLMVYLRAAVSPTAVYAASGDWGAAGSAADTADSASGSALGLDERIRRAAVIAQRPAGRPARDGFADPVPFAELLGGWRCVRGPV